jgi:hypothetical protein
MDRLNNAEFFKGDQEIGGEADDQYRDESTDEFLNIQIMVFLFLITSKLL